MVLFDADFLSLLFHDNPRLPSDPKTKKPVERAKDRIHYLIAHLSEHRERILLPTPAVSEVLCLAGRKAPELLDVLANTYGFEMAPFDVMAAVEAAIITQRVVANKDKRGGASGTWAKIKFDRQIVAIAKTRAAKVVFSNDADVRKLCGIENIPAQALWDLPEPPQIQADLELPYDEDEESP